MAAKMGLYRVFVSFYYGRKSFMLMLFMFCICMTLYFSMYLPLMSRYKTGTHYLNPKVNMEVVNPHIPHGLDVDLLGGEEKSDVDFDSLTLVNLPDTVTERKVCPACFGTDACAAIESGEIKVLEHEEGDVLKIKGVYNGYWNKQPVVIKRLNKIEEYAKVDRFLCVDAGMEPDCDVSQAILSDQSMAQKDSIFDSSTLQQAWKIMHDRPDQLPIAACMTDDGIKTLSEEFHKDRSVPMTKEERALFFTSLVLNPESLFLEFAKKQGLKIHFPEVLGRCGRVVVTEHAGLPLASYLDKPFKERADLAMMLLGMIFFLQNFSTKWSLVFSDFNFDNFYVKDYNLYIVDAEDMLVSDLDVFPEQRSKNKEVCNHVCFEDFATKLFNYKSVERKDICPMTPKVTEQAMYALACERIMSYLAEHRRYSPFRGLLHDPPEEIANFLETGLRECVEETHPEGRMSAVDVLSEMLEKYTDYGNYRYNDDDFDDAYEELPDGGANEAGVQEMQQEGAQDNIQPAENPPQEGDQQNLAAPADSQPAAPAPVENPAAPVENPAAPVENPAAPLENPAVPLENPAAPVENPAAPVENQPALVVNPVVDQAAPFENPAAPLENPAAPLENPAAPVENQPVPVVNPVVDQAAPVENLAAPVENLAAPVENPAAPVENPAAPVENAQVAGVVDQAAPGT